MNRAGNEYLEYRDIIPETILDFKGLRKSITDFKAEQAIDILLRYFYENYPCGEKAYSMFRPRITDASVNVDNQTFDTGTHNIGTFSTALCLETIAAYEKNVSESNKTIDKKKLLWDDGPDRRKNDRRVCEGKCDDDRRTHNRRTHVTPHYGYEKAHSFFSFTIDGLSGSFGPKLGFLARIATLFRFGNYLNHLGIKDGFVDKVDPDVQAKFYKICIECIIVFHKRFTTKREGIHPFELYRFLQFVRLWGAELGPVLKNVEKLKLNLEEGNADDFYQFLGCVQYKEDLVKSSGNDAVFYLFFDQVYLFAKYELYRQMSLKQAGDSRLYDAKRLIYALLVVYLDNKFSNALIRKQALELIFSPFKENRNAIWPTGQQVAMSKDGLMIISDNECVCDLLGCEYLSDSLLDYMPELKCMYDGYARTKRMKNGRIIGWYPIHQRDQTPTSWCTALTLSFIKRFCKLVSLRMSNKAKEKFRSNYKKANVKWKDIYDCTAAKSKIRLIFPEGFNRSRRCLGDDTDIVKQCRYQSAILFGPPGTGKTTYGRAVASKLGLDYLELTPGDFFSGGEDRILVTINDIFEHLLHLKNTVVFIDEIDDLVKDRNPKGQAKNKVVEQPYDPRTLYVNSLLPRFQELHDKKNIILLMATNNIERVDEAISRMGRVDLVIPVGAISPHGRLKFLHRLLENNQEFLSTLEMLSDKDRLDLVIDYLNATEAFSYGVLKHFCEMMVGAVKKVRSGGPEGVKEKIKQVLADQIAKKTEGNPMLIWQGNVVKSGHSYDTRPRHENGDFEDFGHFNLDKFFQTKRLFQEDFVNLYISFNIGELAKNKTNEISQVLGKYCNTFQMEEKNEKGILSKSRSCDHKLYNILTPFYDDIEEAIRVMAGNEDDSEPYNILVDARGHLDKMIFDRSILPE